MKQTHIPKIDLILFLLFASFSISFGQNSTNDSAFIELSFITFNTWALPIWLPKYDRKNRFDKIPKALIETDADFICLQETFAQSIRKKLIDELSKNYYLKTDHSCQSNYALFGKKDCHGGLMSCSKMTVLWETFYAFPVSKKTSLVEKIGKKVFLVSEIESPISNIILINTHLYAGLNEFAEARRLEQLTYLQTIIEKPNLSGKPIFLLGDLNFIHPSLVSENQVFKDTSCFEFVKNTMRFTPSKSHLNIDDLTCSPNENPYCNPKIQSQKLDYIFFRIPKKWEIRVKKCGRVFDQDPILSDHFGWQTTFEIRKSITSSAEISISN